MPIFLRQNKIIEEPTNLDKYDFDKLNKIFGYDYDNIVIHLTRTRHEETLRIISVIDEKYNFLYNSLIELREVRLIREY
jgi:hypothetical protein